MSLLHLTFIFKQALVCPFKFLPVLLFPSTALGYSHEIRIGRNNLLLSLFLAITLCSIEQVASKVARIISNDECYNLNNLKIIIIALQTYKMLVDKCSQLVHMVVLVSFGKNSITFGIRSSQLSHHLSHSHSQLCCFLPLSFSRPTQKKLRGKRYKLNAISRY